MAVPKKRTSRSKRDMRRSHHALVPTNAVENKTTGEFQRSHHIDKNGYYNGRQIIVPKVKHDDDDTDS